jgi:uroporphyrinogen-III synthase
MGSWSGDCDLAGLGVLVTRPAHQADALCDLVTAHGGRPIPFPAIEIHGPRDSGQVKAQLQDISGYDLAIFISPNAVRYGLALVPDRKIPDGLKVAAVGRGTARALRDQGVRVDLFPRERFDSEALLVFPALQAVAGRRILIFRGNGGRRLLGDTLRERGAEVVYAEVYRRELPQVDASTLVACWPEDVQVVIATSNEILDNLFTLLGPAGKELLQGTLLVVVSGRMLSHAKEIGCRKPLQAPRADNESLLQTLCRWLEDERN